MYSKRKIKSSLSIIAALKKMDEEHVKSLLVYSEDKFLSLLTIGDIQRAIIANCDLNSEVVNILDFCDKKYCSVQDSIEDIKSKMLRLRAECMPVVSIDGNIEKIYFWEDLFISQSVEQNTDKINLPVVIMAGGQGTRLKPLTNVIPKPLIPVGEKTFIEDIMDRFVECGSSDFYISINYKADLIKQYFENLHNPRYSIQYFQETKPLGTAGSLTLLKDKINTTFFVTNCDIIIKEDYSQILRYHNANNNELTVVAALKNYPIDYGVLYTEKDGLLDTIVEKPDLIFKINTGLYILEPKLLEEIPENSFYHITHLIDKLKKENRRVGVFPVSEKSWIDVGNWSEYLKIINRE